MSSVTTRNQFKNSSGSCGDNMKNNTGTNDDQNSAVLSAIKSLQISFSSLEATFSTEMNALRSSMDAKLENIMQTNESKYAEINNKITALSFRQENERQYLDQRLDKFERMSISNDLVVYGIPFIKKNESVVDIRIAFESICAKIKFKDSSSSYKLFRIKFNKRKQGTAHNSNKAPPIYVKFASFDQKQSFFQCYMAKLDISLVDIGFKSDARIYINDALTKRNRNIWNTARKLKSTNIIEHAKLLRGLVYIKINGSNEHLCVRSIDQLNSLCKPSVSNFVPDGAENSNDNSNDDFVDAAD